MDASEVAAAIGVEFVGQMPHGEGTGAYAVRTAGGGDAVLKIYTGDVLDLGAPEGLLDAFRARGYPVPLILATGSIDATRYELMERIAGDPIEQVTPGLVAPILHLIELQRDVGLNGRRPWVDDIVTSIVDGRTGYCEHAAMADHSDETRALLDRLRRIAENARDVDVATTDVVHYDFSPYNLLGVGDTIAGVVDWDGTTSGDAAFDLVTLAMYTYDYGVRDELVAAASATSDPRAIALYTAHMVLRQVDWALRHDQTTVEWFLGIGTDLLASLEA